MTAEPPRVLIADDEFHVRAFVKALLLSVPCQVVGEAGDGVEAVALFRQCRPDLTILDVNMPGRTGPDALVDILREEPAARVIMLSSVSDRASVEQCLRLGAVHFMRKDLAAEDMCQIIRDVLAHA